MQTQTETPDLRLLCAVELQELIEHYYDLFHQATGKLKREIKQQLTEAVNYYNRSYQKTFCKP